MGQPELPICRELIGPGAGAIMLTNQNGAVVTLSGRSQD
jgi:hypothetical protein